jgi:hypothetical protein
METEQKHTSLLNLNRHSTHKRQQRQRSAQSQYRSLKTRHDVLFVFRSRQGLPRITNESIRCPAPEIASEKRMDTRNKVLARVTKAKKPKVDTQQSSHAPSALYIPPHMVNYAFVRSRTSQNRYFSAFLHTWIHSGGTAGKQ